MKRKTMRRRSRNRTGFTLLEVLLVLVILVLLGGTAGLYLIRIQSNAYVNQAQNQISQLKQALKLYRLEVGSFPSEQQGLNALVAPPGDLSNPNKWRGPYLEVQVPNDPWERPYKYVVVNSEQVQITSPGPDGQEGTADDITG